MVSSKRIMRTMVCGAHLPLVPSLGFIHGLFLYSLVGDIFSLQVKKTGCLARKEGQGGQALPSSAATTLCGTRYRYRVPSATR